MLSFSCFIAHASLRGGEGGIRTHGTVPRSQHFQCCQFNHSCTSPRRISDCEFRNAKFTATMKLNSVGQFAYVLKFAIRNPQSEIFLAERVGFEPTVGVNPLRFSRPVH